VLKIKKAGRDYLFHTSYWHNGLQYGLQFYAKDFADAARKVVSIRGTLSQEDVSQVLEEFDNNWFYIQWVKLEYWLKNVFHR
jgi:hypothetical protein